MKDMERQGMKGIAGFVGRMMAMAAVLYAAACTDDRLMGDYGGGTAATEATPVRFEIDCEPLYSVTRAAPKLKEWKDGDKIQIQAQFTGSGIDGTDEKQYGCYKYVDDNGDGDWIPDTDGDLIVWPVGSESGTFKAYYLAGANGRISEGQSVNFVLGDIQEGEDPLHAESNLEYGHSVSLNFRHLCTHLTLTDVKTDHSEGYWLYGKTGTEIPNACKLGYTSVGGLAFEFTNSEECRTSGGEEGHYYISRQRNGDGSVDFYLAQEKKEDGSFKYAYGDCELAYRFNHPYLSFTGITSLDSLEVGTHYELSIEKQLGIVPQPETEFPVNPETDLGNVDIPVLLDGIVHGMDVRDDKGNVVLKSEGELHPTLMRDVDFKNFNPMDYIEGTGAYDGQPHPEWKLPVLGGIFDGNYHSFLNVAYPVFDKIEGEIYNLAIRNSTCDITVEDIKKMESLHIRGSESLNVMTDFGLLACAVNGYLDNLLLEKIVMTVHLDNTLSGNTQNRTYRIGCLVGNQETSATDIGTAIGKVELRDEVKLTVTTDEGELDEVQDCYIGTLVGQSGALIDEVTSTGKCTLTVPLKGESTVYAGGLVGRATSTVRNVTLDVEVDCSGLHVLQAYAGGLIGELVNETSGRGTLENCIAGIAVTGGTARPVNNTTYAHAYTGGIAARINSATCSEVTVTGSVTGGTETEAITEYNNMINYATGGGFGYITGGGSTTITGCKALTTVSKAVLQTAVENNDTGNFAGLSDIPATGLEASNSATENVGLEFVGRVGSEPQ